MADTTAPDDLQRMGELVRTIRRLAASEMRLRDALTEVVDRSEPCTACPEVFGDQRLSWCATCIARAARDGEW